MANNKIQIKRTSVTGRAANVTSSGNSQFIDAGEFALNMTDGILYTSNGSALITVGSNLVNQNITGTLTVNSISSNGSTGSAGQVLTSNGSTVYWSAAAGTGTVTSVDTGNGMTGGPITSTGTVSVLANTGIIANSTGVFVDSTYIGAISANNTSFVGSVSAANVVSNAQLASNLTNYVTTTNFTNNLANYQTTAGLSGNVAKLTSNNSTFSYGKTEGALNVNSALIANNSTFSYGKTEDDLNVNSALIANNSTNLGGVAASGYQTTAGLSANVAKLTSNNATNLNGEPASFYLGSMVTVDRFTTPGTYSKPVGLLGVKVIVSGAGGGSCTLTTGPNDAEVVSFRAGGDGGVGIKYIPAPSMPASISVTVGSGGAAGGVLPGADNPVGPAGGTGGTSSFGTFATSTGGSGGTPAGVGDDGVGANANYYATTGPTGILNFFNTSSALTNQWGYGAPNGARAAGKQGIVIIEEYF